MALTLDLGNIGDPTQIHSGGNRPAPGRGMALITGWSEYTGVNGKAHELELEIVAWTAPDSVGKRHTENIFHQDNTGKGFPMKRMTCLAMAAGLFNANDVEQWKRQGVMPEVDFQQLVGRPIMLVLIEEPDKDDKNKTYMRVGEIGLAFYHIKDAKTKDWPKNQGLMNRHAAEVGEWVAASSGAKAPASAHTPTPAPDYTSIVNDPFAGKV